MDALLGRVTQQAVNYAIRSGVTITAGYAFKQCGRLLKEAPRGKEREELMQVQLRLESKIKIISPAIDMIDLIAARGNNSLESAVSLTKEIRYEIQRLGTRLSQAANEEELLKRNSSRAKSRDETDRELRSVINQIKALLGRIEDAVPLINLAITTSGVNLSTKLSGTISPSRLLQASTFLTAADGQYAAAPGSRAQVGPTYILSMYMLFAGHAWRPVDEDGVRETTWKEVIHKAKVKLVRLPLDCLYDLPGDQTQSNGNGNTFRESHRSAEFAYQLFIVEDLDDDRAHTFDEGEPQPGAFDEVAIAGIRDVIAVHEISKVFYADTGKILNIGSNGETNSPVLLLKRDVYAEPPRRMLQRSQSMERDYPDDELVNGGPGEDVAVDGQTEVDAQIRRESTPNTPLKEAPGKNTSASNAAWRLPADLDPEWIAFEVFSEDPNDSESEPDEPADSEPDSSRPSSSREGSLDPGLTGALSKLTLRSQSTTSSPTTNGQLIPSQLSAMRQTPNKRAGPPIKTSLSLLELLMKLAALQQFRQESHLAIEDELLNFFLEDSATAGAGPDKEYRQRLRHDAMKRVGFDPYDESPIKRHSEEYIQHTRGAASPRPSFDADAFAGRLPYNDGYGYDNSPDFARSSMEQTSYSREATPSSPSPRPRQTPPHNDPLDTSKAHRKEVQAKYAGSRPASQASSLATPPSTTRSRQAFLRAQSEPKPRSPLGREVMRRHGDERIGPSPSGADLEGERKG